MSSTLESLGIDSVGVVEVIFTIEEEFDINIPYNANETLSKRLDFSNVLSIVELVSELVRDNHKF
ncbi:MAG: phosphopantetheine-binding protein [Rhodobacteraceae bacterium]|nr:MAG: phosphopantetheine-binding protein [Paracoccaceae bacterium]